MNRGDDPRGLGGKAGWSAVVDGRGWVVREAPRLSANRLNAARRSPVIGPVDFNPRASFAAVPRPGV